MPVILSPKPGGDVVKKKKFIFIKPQNRLSKQNRVGSVLFPTLSSQLLALAVDFVVVVIDVVRKQALKNDRKPS